MASLTLAIDRELLTRARVRAVAEATSVNAVVREFLERYAGASDVSALGSFLVAARRSRVGSGPGGRSWSRTDLHEDRIGP